jgi:hypothetical protein
MTVATVGLYAKCEANAGTVSLIQLIANPGKYDGRQVGVIGFLRLEFEGNRLYFHKHHYSYNISENAVRVGLTKTQNREFADKNMQYVFVVGTFKAGIEDGSNANGTLVNITAIKPWPVVRPTN